VTRRADGPRVTVVRTADELADATARAVVDRARESIAARGWFLLALTGGGTPRQAYARLATEYADAVPWEKTHVFLGDERWVPPTDARSNFGMARDALLRHVPAPDAQVHPMVSGGATPHADAERYERMLRGYFADDGSPTFDLTLMGVGPDGHVASLFPGDPAVRERSRWALAVQAPEPFEVRDRVTLALPVINRSRHVLFIAGTGKRDIVRRVLAATGGPAGGDALPASLVRGVESTEWLVLDA
jgi:6-phosphogluconolactonase